SRALGLKGSSRVGEVLANSSSSISSSSSVSKKKIHGARIGFDFFWKAYPKKRSKPQAVKAWDKLQPDDVLVGVMLRKLEQAKQSPEWTKDGGQFIPYPAT